MEMKRGWDASGKLRIQRSFTSAGHSRRGRPAALWISTSRIRKVRTDCLQSSMQTCFRCPKRNEASHMSWRTGYFLLVFGGTASTAFAEKPATLVFSMKTWEGEYM